MWMWLKMMSLKPGWWLTYPALWKIWKSVGIMKFPVYGKRKNVPNHQPVKGFFKWWWYPKKLGQIPPNTHTYENMASNLNLWHVLVVVGNKPMGIYLSATESGTIWCHHFEGLAVLIWPYNILAFQEGPPLADWQLCRSLGTGWNSRILYPIRSQHKSWHSLKIRSLPFHLLDPCSTDSNRSSWSIPHSPRPLRRWAVRTLPSMAVWEKIRSTT